MPCQSHSLFNATCEACLDQALDSYLGSKPWSEAATTYQAARTSPKPEGRMDVIRPGIGRGKAKGIRRWNLKGRVYTKTTKS